MGATGLGEGAGAVVADVFVVGNVEGPAVEGVVACRPGGESEIQTVGAGAHDVEGAGGLGEAADAVHSDGGEVGDGEVAIRKVVVANGVAAGAAVVCEEKIPEGGGASALGEQAGPSVPGA